MIQYDPPLVPGKGGGGGDSHIIRGGMLVVSLSDINFRFWSHLGCSGQNAIIYGREGLFYVCARRNIKVSLHFYTSSRK